VTSQPSFALYPSAKTMPSAAQRAWLLPTLVRSHPLGRWQVVLQDEHGLRLELVVEADEIGTGPFGNGLLALPGAGLPGKRKGDKGQGDR